ncbi:MAG: glycosyltransferase family 2 protein [Bacteroidota bacterium]
MKQKQEKDTTPFVVISLLNWMNYDDTIQCVESILLLDYPNFEIVLCDNASPNTSFELLKQRFPDLIIHQTSVNNGFASGHWANYQIAKERKADLFWILNSDLVLNTHALKALVEVNLQHPNSILGSVSLDPENKTLVDFGGAPFTTASQQQLHYNVWKGKKLEELQKQNGAFYEVESVEGSSMLVQMQVIEKYGFMKLDFFMYAEETDFCYRMRSKNCTSLVVTNSLVYHKNEGSTNSYPRLKIITTYYRRRNALRFSNEHLNLSRWQILSYQSGFLGNLKALLKGAIVQKKELSFYFALACFHAAFGIKGKKIKPEKLL